MALVFTSDWPAAGAGTLDADDIRQRKYLSVRADVRGDGIGFHFSSDGTQTGGISLQTGGSCPWISAPTADLVDRGGWGMVGCYGPVYDPSADRGGTARDLYFWRYEYDSGNLRWKVEVFPGGTDQDGFVIGGAASRQVYAHLISGTGP